MRPDYILPPGWQEVPEFNSLGLCLRAPDDKGFITISLGLRTYCFGLNPVNRTNARKTIRTFTGPRWLQRMIDQAVIDFSSVA
jgi:hypothetical protein